MTDDAREPRDVQQVQRGGRATATLNHLLSLSPIREWIETKQEIEQLLSRLEKLTRDCAQHELMLRLVGVSDEELYTALAADRDRREGNGASEPSTGVDGRKS